MYVSPIGYCNFLLVGITLEQMARLQRVQNNAPPGWLSSKALRACNTIAKITPLASHETTHWIQIGNLCLCFPLLRHYDGTLPLYLSDFLSSYTPCRTPRSSSDKLLSVPRVNWNCAGAGSFQYQVPSVGNSLPVQMRMSASLASFMSNLKTHLFHAAFTWNWWWWLGMVVMESRTNVRGCCFCRCYCVYVCVHACVCMCVCVCC